VLATVIQPNFTGFDERQICRAQKTGGGNKAQHNEHSGKVDFHISIF
jgi:hypothetical protein